MHTYRPGNLRDEIPKRRRLWPTPGCNAMEEEAVDGKSYAEFLTDLLMTNCETSCNNCEKVIKQLQNVLSELSSAKLIIELLQNKIYNCGIPENANVYRSEYKCGEKCKQEETNIGNWITVSANCSRKLNRCTLKPVKQPMVTFNRFAPFSDFHEIEYTVPYYNSSIRRTAISLQTKTLRKHKIIVIGDSHVKGYSAKLIYLLGNS
jgi:hypothetical protein